MRHVYRRTSQKPLNDHVVFTLPISTKSAIALVLRGIMPMTTPTKAGKVRLGVPFSTTVPALDAVLAFEAVAADDTPVPDELRAA